MTLVATVASLMTAAGVPRLHVEKVLNHEIDDVAEIYDRHDYAAEKAAALKTCSRTLRRILIRESPNVIPFRRDAALPRASPAADSQPPNRGRTLYTDEP